MSGYWLIDFSVNFNGVTSDQYLKAFCVTDRTWLQGRSGV